MQVATAGAGKVSQGYGYYPYPEDPVNAYDLDGRERCWNERQCDQARAASMRAGGGRLVPAFLRRITFSYGRCFIGCAGVGFQGGRVFGIGGAGGWALKSGGTVGLASRPPARRSSTYFNATLSVGPYGGYVNVGIVRDSSGRSRLDWGDVEVGWAPGAGASWGPMGSRRIV